MFTVFWSVSDGVPSFTTVPSHTAGLVGEASRISCAADYTGGLTWLFQTDLMANAENVYISQVTSAEDFEINNELFDGNSSSLHDLTIKTSAHAASGYYECKAFDNDWKSTSSDKVTFTALDPLACSVNSDRDEFEEGTTPDLQCQVTYTGPLKPRLTWVADGHESQGNVQADSDAAENPPAPGEQRSLTVTYNLTVEAHHDQVPFICKATFVQEDNPSITEALPEFSTSCNLTFGVTFGVRDIVFTPDPDDVLDGEKLVLKVGEHIMCNASGSEPITYQWMKDNLDAGGPMNVYEQHFGMSYDMVGYDHKYTCIAKNRVNNVEIALERFIEFTVITNAARILHYSMGTLLTLLIVQIQLMNCS